MTNSLNEFGYAKWFLHPLSIAGLYPASYTSSVQFLLSGISQSANIEMEPAIFLYCVIFGVLSVFTGYLMAKGIYHDDDLFKVLVAFAYSTSPAIVEYTTWTIPTRSLLIIMAPLLIYLLLKSVNSFKYMPLAFVLSMLLFLTHHLFYFLIPVFFAFFIFISYVKLKINSSILGNLGKFIPFLIILGFVLMFSIPFFTGKFIETSRYLPVDISYIRYVGLLFVFILGGLFYLIFKNRRTNSEWFLLLSLIFLTIFIYEQTYMKWFIPVYAIPLACIGLINVIKIKNNKYIPVIFVIILISSLSFSGYYQFLHTYRETPYDARYVEESTYSTGSWMRDHIDGISISNDIVFGERIFAASETAHLFTDRTTTNQIYGFSNINISDYKRYPLTTEDFWFSGYEGPDIGEVEWEKNHDMRNSPNKYNISYIVENKKSRGKLIWNHGYVSSKLLELAYENNLIYDAGDISLWEINKTET
jgi:hypothetical protein